jgi:hypothetical protein
MADNIDNLTDNEIAGIINRYSQIVNQPIIEKMDEFHDNDYDDYNYTRYYKLSIGELSITNVKRFTEYNMSDTDLTKKELKKIAVKKFLIKYYDVIKNTHKKIITGTDYLLYSRQTILNKSIRSYFNHKILTKPKIITIDSEGQPIKLAQIATNDTTVYLLTDFEYVKTLLQDPDIKKIVCDVEAEERVFGCKIINYHDIQGEERKSLTRCINEKYNINLVKDKRIHFNNWDILSEDHIDYAIADVIWLWKLIHE